MSQEPELEQQQEPEQEPKLTLPKGWRWFNFIALHLAYLFGTLFASLRPSAVQEVILKEISQETFDKFNAYILIIFIVCSACSGALNGLRGKTIKDFVDVVENARKPK